MVLYDFANRTHYSLIATKADNGRSCPFAYAHGTAYLLPLKPSGPLLAVPLYALHDVLAKGTVEILNSSREAMEAPKSPSSLRAARLLDTATNSLQEIGKQVRGTSAPALTVRDHVAVLAAMHRTYEATSPPSDPPTSPESERHD